MAPGKPSTNSRDKQDLDYLHAVFACSDVSAIHHWDEVHKMTTAMGYNWSRKTVSNYWSERVAKAVQAAKKVLADSLLDRSGGDATDEADTKPQPKRKSTKKRKREAANAATTAAKAVEAAPAPVAQPAKKRQRKARVPAAPTAGTRNKRAPPPASKKTKADGPGSLFPDTEPEAEPKVAYEKNFKLEPLVKEDDSE